LTNNKKNQEIMPDEKKKMPLANAASKAVKASAPKPSMSSKPSAPKRSATLEKKMTTVSTSRDTTRTAYPEKISPSGRKSQLTKVTYSSAKKIPQEGKTEPMQRRMK
jgi:hypothetical protein